MRLQVGMWFPAWLTLYTDGDGQIEIGLVMRFVLTSCSARVGLSRAPAVPA